MDGLWEGGPKYKTYLPGCALDVCETTPPRDFNASNGKRDKQSAEKVPLFQVWGVNRTDDTSSSDEDLEEAGEAPPPDSLEDSYPVPCRRCPVEEKVLRMRRQRGSDPAAFSSDVLKGYSDTEVEGAVGVCLTNTSVEALGYSAAFEFLPAYTTNSSSGELWTKQLCLSMLALGGRQPEQVKRAGRTRSSSAGSLMASEEVLKPTKRKVTERTRPHVVNVRGRQLLHWKSIEHSTSRQFALLQACRYGVLACARDLSVPYAHMFEATVRSVEEKRKALRLVTSGNSKRVYGGFEGDAIARQEQEHLEHMRRQEKERQLIFLEPADITRPLLRAEQLTLSASKYAARIVLTFCVNSLGGIENAPSAGQLKLMGKAALAGLCAWIRLRERSSNADEDPVPKSHHERKRSPSVSSAASMVERSELVGAMSVVREILSGAISLLDMSEGLPALDMGSSARCKLIPSTSALTMERVHVNSGLMPLFPRASFSYAQRLPEANYGLLSSTESCMRCFQALEHGPSRFNFTQCGCCGIVACSRCCRHLVCLCSENTSPWRKITRVCDHCIQCSSRINLPRSVDLVRAFRCTSSVCIFRFPCPEYALSVQSYFAHFKFVAIVQYVLHARLDPLHHNSIVAEARPHELKGENMKESESCASTEAKKDFVDGEPEEAVDANSTPRTLRAVSLSSGEFFSPLAVACFSHESMSVAEKGTTAPIGSSSQISNMRRVSLSTESASLAALECTKYSVTTLQDSDDEYEIVDCTRSSDN